MIFDDKDDASMRQRILATLIEVDKVVPSRHVNQFSVVRTVNRKGHRTAVATFNDKWTQDPYYGDPRIRISIEIELPDNVTEEFSELVAELTEIEEIGERRAKEKRLEAAKARACAVQDEVALLERELGEG